MAKNDHTGRKIAVGAAIVGAVGYVAGILTAPKSGKETRTDIANKAEDTKEEIEMQLQNVHDELEGALKTAKSKSIALSSKTRAEFNEAVVNAKDAKNKTAHLLKAVKAGEAEDIRLDRAIRQAKAAVKNLAKYFKD